MYCVNPLQSKPVGSAPPHTYGAPTNCIANAATSLPCAFDTKSSGAVVGIGAGATSAVGASNSIGVGAGATSTVGASTSAGAGAGAASAIVAGTSVGATAIGASTVATGAAVGTGAASDRPCSSAVDCGTGGRASIIASLSCCQP